MGDHFFNSISFFFNTYNLPPCWCKTFVALIPKKYNTLTVFDFHLFSLYNVCYKVISKILANCLRKVINKLIEPEQTCFLTGCGSSDNVIDTQEFTHCIEFEYPTPPPKG